MSDDLMEAQRREAERRRNKELRIMVVEDEAEHAARLRALLSRAETDFVVDVFGWLETGIQTAAIRQYHCVLLDLYLPNGRGIDAAAEFMRRVPLVPVIVMAGERDLEVAVQCVRHGAESYWIKTRTDAELLELAILAAIERKHRNLVNTALIRTSVETMLEREPEPMDDRALVRSHVGEIDATLREVAAYLARNAPAHAEAVRSILDRRGFGGLVFEVAEQLELAGEAWDDQTPPSGRARERKSSDTALRIVREVVKRHSVRPDPRSESSSAPAPKFQPPSSPTEASARLLSVIERNRKPRRTRGVGRPR
jgi:FixJ family two-component response regulator